MQTIVVKACRIEPVGKRRDGNMRHWCIEHRADATGPRGVRLAKCRYAHVPPVLPEETLTLDVSRYSGGVALWGAVPPVYDTTRFPVERGIHVHARPSENGEKEIDQTFRAVSLVGVGGTLFSREIVIGELEAIYYMVSSVFGYPVKDVTCTKCGYPHLDKDWFSVHPHHRHLCAGCGRHFRDSERAIGNPIRTVQEAMGRTGVTRTVRGPSLNIKQSEYPDGIQMWGSNPAFLWTSKRSERHGVHVHAYRDGKRVIDNTYSQVKIDGVTINPDELRVYMAQASLPHIEGRVVGVDCPRCRERHVDTGENAFTPHDQHCCPSCGHEFLARGRFRKTIGNPVVSVFATLARQAPRSPQKHRSELITETL